ncbi:MAG: hypothetical protein AAGK78_06350, partial [Planctomycetota bacterium]
MNNLASPDDALSFLPDENRGATRDDANAFPDLTDDQIERAKAFGDVQSLEEGTYVFKRGERTVPFYIILEGCIEILDEMACDIDGKA